jgi:hypothetical protein
MPEFFRLYLDALCNRSPLTAFLLVVFTFGIIFGVINLVRMRIEYRSPW